MKKIVLIVNAASLIMSLQGGETKNLSPAAEKSYLSSFYDQVTSSFTQFNSVYSSLTQQLEDTASYFLGSAGSKLRVQPQSPLKVEEGKNISLAEKKFLSAWERNNARKKSLEEILSIKKLDRPLKIGLSVTGGGFRAMILTGGYMAALEEWGVLAWISHIAALSGSTWFLIPWMMSQLSVHRYQTKIAQKIQDGTLSISSSILQRADMDLVSFWQKVIWPKIAVGQPVGWVDWYGGLLSYLLFHEKGTVVQGSQWYDHHFSDLASIVEKGLGPLPLCASISMHKDTAGNARYNWYEFTPFDVRNLTLGLSVPMSAFGSNFNKGLQTSMAPEQSLGFFLGMFGSALAINFADATRIFFDEAEKKEEASYLEAMQSHAVRTLLAELKKIYPKFFYNRYMAAQVPNPFFGMSTPLSNWLTGRKLLTFLDAGPDANIPILSLMQRERELDVIIVADSSSDADTGQEAKKMINTLIQEGFDYKRVDTGSSNSLHFYKTSDSRDPRIIYLNFFIENQQQKIDNDKELSIFAKQHKLDTFNISACINSGACNTFNFNYTPEEFEQLSSLGSLAIMVYKDAIAKFIAQEFGKAEE